MSNKSPMFEYLKQFKADNVKQNTSKEIEAAANAGFMAAVYFIGMEYQVELGTAFIRDQHELERQMEFIRVPDKTN